MLNYLIYIIAAGSALILGMLLKQPLLPESPKRQSWTLSAVFPTTVLALGFTAMISKLGYFTSSNLDYLIALAIGVITAIFSRYLLETILPKPKTPTGNKDKPDGPDKPDGASSGEGSSGEGSNEDIKEGSHG